MTEPAEFPLPEPYQDGTAQDHADALRDHADGVDRSLITYLALAGAGLIERQAAELAQLGSDTTTTDCTDELARNAARNAIADLLLSALDGTSFTEDYESTSVLADTAVRNHTVTWEREVNEANVPVRRYVLRSAWEVDPEGLAHTPIPAALKPRFALEADAVAAMVAAGLIEMGHTGTCVCEGTTRVSASCVDLTVRRLRVTAATYKASA